MPERSGGYFDPSGHGNAGIEALANALGPFLTGGETVNGRLRPPTVSPAVLRRCSNNALFNIYISQANRESMLCAF